MTSRRESDFARLERLLAEAKEQAQRERQERQQAEEETQRERQERQQAEEEAQRERQKRQRAEHKTRRTSFSTYLKSCHTLLSLPIQVQRDKSLSTQGSITSPKDRPCPTYVKPWKEFPAIHHDHFERVSANFPPNEEYFDTLQYLEEHGQKRCSRPIASEKDLELYHHVTVEEPVTEIISKLQENDAARKDLNLKYGIFFDNHANGLDDENEEVQEGIQNLEISNKPTAQRQGLKPRQADRIFIYKATDGSRKLCMLIEYKAPHKVSVANLRAGLLRADKGSWNIYTDVINCATIPNSPDPNTSLLEAPHAKFIHKSEWLIAAVITQTYSYMVESGLEYSCFTQGEAYIMFHVKKDEPHTIYYHLAEPNYEAHLYGDEISLCYTAISQMLTICLLAFGSTPYSLTWRRNTLKSAYRATIDPKMILRQFPEEERDSTPSPSAFLSDPDSDSPVKRSPIKLRSKRGQQSRETCGRNELQKRNDPRNPNDSSDEDPDANTPTKPKTRAAALPTTRRLRSHTKKTTDTSEEGKGGQKRYCTHKCLWGLTHCGPLDRACPNVDAHRVYGFGKRHALDRETFVTEVSHQLERTLDDDCEPLGKQGSRGALFRLTLQSHGYVFVAKGTVLAFTENLKQEARVYHRLRNLQGEIIPVFLGSVDLKHCYFLDVGVRIVHMLFMSWGGESIPGDSILSLDEKAIKFVRNAEIQLRTYGVDHADIEPGNILRDSCTQRMMLIDFERAKDLSRRPPLREIANLKRKRLNSTKDMPYKGAYM